MAWTGPWARLLDTGRTLELPVVLDNSSQARRAAGGIRAAAQRIRAERTGATQSTLGTLDSLPPTASLTDKLTSSQYALGECRCRLIAQLDSKGRSCGPACSWPASANYDACKVCADEAEPGPKASAEDGGTSAAPESQEIQARNPSQRFHFLLHVKHWHPPTPVAFKLRGA